MSIERRTPSKETGRDSYQDLLADKAAGWFWVEQFLTQFEQTPERCPQEALRWMRGLGPCCFTDLCGGVFAVVNRDYAPLGVFSPQGRWADPEDHLHCHVRLNAAQRALLLEDRASWDPKHVGRDPSAAAAASLWLFDDDNTPFNLGRAPTAQERRRYADCLRGLLRLRDRAGAESATEVV